MALIESCLAKVVGEVTNASMNYGPGGTFNDKNGYYIFVFTASNSERVTGTSGMTEIPITDSFNASHLYHIDSDNATISASDAINWLIFKVE